MLNTSTMIGTREARIICGLILLAHSPSSSAETDDIDWSYEDQGDWGNKYEECLGKHQSPINIDSRFVVQNSDLNIQFFNYDRQTTFKFENENLTVALTQALEEEENEYGRLLFKQTESIKARIKIRIKTVVRKKSSARQLQHVDNVTDLLGEDPSNIPGIRLSWMPEGENEYELENIHFHWGEWRHSGSEHAIDGQRASMEMHLVHELKGLDKSEIERTPNSLVVIAVLIESFRKNNADFKPILDALPLVNATNKPVEVDFDSIFDLMPDHLIPYYTYSGSLTTPPCNQIVTWIVLADRVRLKEQDIERFRDIYAPPIDGFNNSEPEMMMPNVRSLQPRNGRIIMASVGPLDKQNSQVEFQPEPVVPVSREESLSEPLVEPVVPVSREESLSEPIVEPVVPVSREGSLSEPIVKPVVPVGREESLSEPLVGPVAEILSPGPESANIGGKSPRVRIDEQPAPPIPLPSVDSVESPEVSLGIVPQNVGSEINQLGLNLQQEPQPGLHPPHQSQQQLQLQPQLQPQPPPQQISPSIHHVNVPQQSQVQSSHQLPSYQQNRPQYLNLQPQSASQLISQPVGSPQQQVLSQTILNQLGLNQPGTGDPAAVLGVLSQQQQRQQQQQQQQLQPQQIQQRPAIRTYG